MVKKWFTKKRELASNRNWVKARLISITAGLGKKELHTEEELEIINHILSLKNKLLLRWDDNSRKLGMNIKRYDLLIKNDDGEFEIWKQDIPHNEASFLVRELNKNNYKIRKTRI